MLLLGTCLLAATSFSLEDGTSLVERVLAVVDEHPLLLSEVEAVERVRGLDRAAALRATIDERLMFQEASRLPQAAVSEEEAERALRSLLETRPELEGVDRVELLRMMSRQACILRYVDFRFRPQIRIDEDAVRAAWNDEHGGEPEGAAFEDEAPAVRARLERRALDQRIEEWIARLRERAEIRYVEGPGSPPRPSGGP